MCVSLLSFQDNENESDGITNLSSGQILSVDTGGGLKLEIFHGSFHEIKERHQITSVQRIVAAREEKFRVYVGDLSSLTTKTLN